MKTSNERKCSKCGTALSGDELFCPNCGRKNGSKAKNKLLLFGIPSVFVVLAAVGITFAVVLNSPINVFSRCLDSNDFVTAVETYNNNSGSEDFLSKADKLVEKFTSDTVSSYAAGQKTEEYVETMCSELGKITDISDDTALIDDIRSSKEAFKTAEKFENDGDYKNAITSFLAVRECDTEFYSTAVDKASDCKDKYTVEVLQKAKSLADNKEFTKSKSVLKDAIDFGLDSTDISNYLTNVIDAEKQSICDEAISKYNNEQNKIKGYVILSAVKEEYYVDGFKEKLEGAKSEAEDFVHEFVEDCISQKKYVDCYNLLDSLPDGLCQSDLKDMKSEVKLLYKNEAITEAERYASQKNYDKAIEVLDEAADRLNDVRLDFYDYFLNYMEQADIQKVLEYKGNVFVDYDEFERSYSIAAFNLRYYTDYLYTHASPRILYENDIITYGIAFAFVRSDWIFTDELIINCDDYQIRFDVENQYSDLREVLNGGDIFEACVIAHASYDTSGPIKNLSEMIEHMSSAKSVKVRFSGSKGNYDVELRDDEIKAIVNLWELYEIIHLNPELISYLM